MADASPFVGYDPAAGEAALKDILSSANPQSSPPSDPQAEAAQRQPKYWSPPDTTIQQFDLPIPGTDLGIPGTGVTAPTSVPTARGAEDVGVGLSTGLVRGGVAGGPWAWLGDAEAAVRALGHKVTGLLGHPTPESDLVPVAPTSADFLRWYEGGAGKLPEPQTPLGQGAEKAAQFVSPQIEGAALIDEVGNYLRRAKFARGVGAGPIDYTLADTMKRTVLPAMAGGVAAAGGSQLGLSPLYADLLGTGVNAVAGLPALAPGAAATGARTVVDRVPNLPQAIARQHLANSRALDAGYDPMAPTTPSTLTLAEASGNPGALRQLSTITQSPWARGVSDERIMGRGQMATDIINNNFGRSVAPGPRPTIPETGQALSDAATSGLALPWRQAEEEVAAVRPDLKTQQVPATALQPVIDRLEGMLTPSPGSASDAGTVEQAAAARALPEIALSRQVETGVNPVPGSEIWGGDTPVTQTVRQPVTNANELWKKLQLLKEQADPGSGRPGATPPADTWTAAERQGYHALNTDNAPDGTGPGPLAQLDQVIRAESPAYAAAREAHDSRVPLYKASRRSPVRNVMNADNTDAFNAARTVARGTGEAPGEPATVDLLHDTLAQAEAPPNQPAGTLPPGQQAFTDYVKNDVASRLDAAQTPTRGYPGDLSPATGGKFFAEGPRQAQITDQQLLRAAQDEAARRGLTGPAAANFAEDAVTYLRGTRDTIGRHGSMPMSGSWTSPMATTEHIMSTTPGLEGLAGLENAVVAGPEHAWTELARVPFELARRARLAAGYRQVARAAFSNNPQDLLDLARKPGMMYGATIGLPLLTDPSANQP